jgi:ankyrin repeat protein
LIYLLQASGGGWIEVVKELLNHNADIEAKDNDGNTALILGIVSNYLFNLNKKLFIIYSCKEWPH